jgi:putative transposase
MEVIMHDEWSRRQAAIRLRLAGESIQAICRTVQRTEPWFHKWRKRYLALGPEGLYDLTRGTRRVVNRIPPHIERAVISIRQRLAARATPQSRYTLVGAPQIRAELEVLGYTPLPSLRTIERIVTNAGLSCPPLRLSRPLAKTEYPGPQAHDTNQPHQVDAVGPRYLQGDPTRYYFLVLRGAFDLSVYLELVDSRKMEGVLAFLARAWQQLGLPQQVQFDNGREFCGFGPSAPSFSQVIRLCLRLGVEPVFIPKRRPERNGAVEQFNGWFQPVLLNRPYRRPADLRRELRRLMSSVNEQHVHPQLGHRTSAQYRRSKRLRKLPADFTLDGQQLPLAVGKVSFLRLVSAQGTINILEQPYQVGNRLKFQYVKATIFTRERTLKVYYRGRVVKDLLYKLAVQ